MLTLDKADPSPDSRLLEKTVDYYRLTHSRAEAISEEVKLAGRGSRAAAANLRMPFGQISAPTAIIDERR